MSCYFVAKISVRDRERYARYLAGTDEVLEAHEGKVLAVDEDVTVLEGQWNCTRTVLIEFPSEESAEAWYKSPEYQSIAVHRLAASSTDAVFVKGRN
jgi:uncharacterized protein (DUF1330 family)